MSTIAPRFELPRRATHRPAASMMIAALLILSACAGSNSETATSNDPAVTFATLPDDSADAPNDLQSDAVQPDEQPTDPTVISAPTTVVIAPTVGADLPTGSPEELATEQPTTAITGPLPTPAVQLADFGQFNAPVEVTSRDFDGSTFDARTFVVEQGGRIHAVDDLSSEIVLDITALTAANGELGLLGAAFHPEQDLAYVHYTNLDGNTVLAEYEIDPVTAVFDPESQREVLTVEQPFANHNGGEIAFGPDGYLYIGLGDGGSGGDPERNSLNLSTRLGKLLRIDPRAAANEPFTVPADNPFIDAANADPAIWSLGLRNPWKFSFDSATGDLWIADVGQNELEEIDFAPAISRQDAGRGLSFGWSALEGDIAFNGDQTPDGHTLPIITYGRAAGCSVSGGAVYRGTAVPDLVGWYVYGDFCTGQIWGYDPTSGRANQVIVELAQLPTLAAIAVGGEGELFAVSNAGTVSRFAPE